jgi:hypothetical protein
MYDGCVREMKKRSDTQIRMVEGQGFVKFERRAANVMIIQ